ncbi:MAG: hypothetical protein COT89_02755 [Candidatus Colwellbacteria bacterium CG10_big_fil_rev_8_21_14_0_10_42_22]|uniref:GtrA/DPMS transmembrane domain-containing protein n=1 Tax=Candidatus Colwellbacteria bacterium CG10_big_fil_rev_8_21_14_0_10_42_22 TaxID=1974540 RepID=A0A2H0VFD8_9BACT|nr:MAG: hypothetical protein COT89_02755 [Candidatus Colwellbacteria bacterium CG10_big_fil_rev_8_21_14_0_10_42_22]
MSRKVNLEEKDLKAGLLASVLIAVLAYPTLNNISFINQYGALIVVGASFALGFLALRALILMKILSRWWVMFWQLGKFALTGALNTFLDFAILNLLITLTGITEGLWASVFKTLAFGVAVINSYFWNKYWTFEATESRKRSEFVEFILVSVLSLGVNVGTFSLVNALSPTGGLNPTTWANVSALAATAIAWIFNFLGYKFLVFRKKEEATS